MKKQVSFENGKIVYTVGHEVLKIEANDKTGSVTLTYINKRRNRRQKKNIVDHNLAKDIAKETSRKLCLQDIFTNFEMNW